MRGAAPTRAAPEAVIFDCDGTLVDSETLGNEVLAECLREHGLELSARECERRFRGRKLADTLLELEAQLGRSLPGSFVPTFRARMEQSFRSSLRPVEGAEELLSRLELPFCVASSGPRAKIVLSLRLTGLARFFEGRDCIFSSYELGSWKPDPGLFLHAASVLGVEPERTLVIEDSLHGLLAGRAAGMSVLALQQRDRALELPPGVRSIRRLLDVLAHLD